MGSVQKVFTFESDLETLAKVAGDGNFTIALDAANSVTVDGISNSTNSGSADLSNPGSVGANPSITARQSGSFTWESWGVPPGATVTKLLIGRYWYNHWGSAPTAYRHRIRVVDGSGTSLHSTAGELVDNSPAVTPSTVWRSAAGNGLRALNAGKGVSTQAVKLEIQLDSTSGAGTNPDVAFDAIALSIEFDDPPVPVAEKTVYVSAPMHPRR